MIEIEPNFIENVCRICLKETSDMKFINSKLEESEILETNITEWADVLHRILDLPILMEDKYPRLLCTTCIQLILAAYRFRVQYENSNAILQQYQLSLEEKAKILDESNVEDGHETSRQQTDKLESTIKVEIKVPKTRSKKLKTKFVNKLENSLSPGTSIMLHPCPICTKQFPALEFRKHIQTHNALKKYLKISTNLQINPTARFYKIVDPDNRSPVGNEIRLHKCTECKDEFSATDLQSHIPTHRNKKEFKCKECSRTFKKINHLTTHTVQHLKEHPFKCEQCGKGFVIEKNYECHMLTHNASQELPHECRYCLKRFSNPEHLNRHLTKHTENVSYHIKYKVCKCQRCLKTFKDKAELSLHNCVPIGKSLNYTFSCKKCFKSFNNASRLYNHNRTNHKLKEGRTLCCVCGNRVSNIYNHMMAHTGDKRFECALCGKRFLSKPQVRQHLLVHSGLKPFVCSLCGKAFNSLYNLQVHERIHKGDRCHVCPLCGKGFLEKSYLKKHLSVHAKS